MLTLSHLEPDSKRHHGHQYFLPETLGVGFLRSPAGYCRGKAAGGNCYTCPYWQTSNLHVTHDMRGTVWLECTARVSDRQLEEDGSKIVGRLPSWWDSISIGEFKTEEIPHMFAV